MSTRAIAISFAFGVWLLMGTVEVKAFFIRASPVPPTAAVTPPVDPPPPPPGGEGETPPEEPPIDPPPPTSTPEPASLVTALLGAGIASAYAWRRRRTRGE